MRARLAVLFWADVAALYRVARRRSAGPIEEDVMYSRICRRLEKAIWRVR